MAFRAELTKRTNRQQCLIESPNRQSLRQLLKSEDRLGIVGDVHVLQMHSVAFAATDVPDDRFLADAKLARVG
jgi:hypothetical protein